MSRYQTRLKLGFAATAGALALASSAFACTTFLGQSTVTGSGGTPSVAHGDASRGMAWCPGHGAPSGSAQVGPGSDTVTFTPAPHVAEARTRKVAGCPASQMGNASDWVLTTLPGDWEVDRTGATDCMLNNVGAPVPTNISVGKVIVTSGGVITSVNGVPASSVTSDPFAFPPGPNMVCLSHIVPNNSSAMNKITAL